MRHLVGALFGFVLLAAVLPAARVTVCASGCDYTAPQAAIDAASYGDIIELTAGETFAGEMQLKKKTGTPAYIVIRSSQASALPGNVRVTPADTASMAKLQHSAGVVTVEAGASYYRLEGLEIAPTSGHFVWFLVALWPQTEAGGIGVHEASDRAHHIILDRCYIHGIAGEDGPQAGVYLETGYTEITNSWLGEIKNANGEAKAILNVGGSGPFRFRNNHLEAAAITTLMGGATPTISGQRATNVQFLGNHYYRPWKWRIQDVTVDPTGACMWDANGGEFAKNTTTPTYWQCQSGAWTEIAVGAYPPIAPWQKNQFELKNASRVLFDGNLIENAWMPAAQSQRGSSMLFNQVDTDEFSATVSHVLVANNLIRRTPTGVAVGRIGSGYYYLMHDIRVAGNLWDHVSEEPYTQNQLYFVQTNQAISDYAVVGNTVITARGADGGYGAVGFLNNYGTDYTYRQGFIGNLVPFLGLGFQDTEKGSGLIDSQWHYPDRALSKNVFVDDAEMRLDGYWGRPIANLWRPSTSPYSLTIPCASCSVPSPGIETFPEGGAFHWENSGTNDVGFVDYAAGNYRLAATSPYKGWSHEGADPGADIDVVEWSTGAVEAGTANPYLDFRVRALLPSTTTASLRYTAYSTAACAVTVAGNPSYTSPEFTDAGASGNRDRLLSITGLASAQRYWWRVICGGAQRRSGVFWTR